MIFPGKGIYAKGVLGLKACLKKNEHGGKTAVLNFNFAHFFVLKRQP